MRLVFVRHPETVANAENIIYGKMDYPYTDKGESQVNEAVSAVSNFDVSAVVSSPLGRAYNLAKPMSEALKLPLTSDSALEEMCYGILEGLGMEEAEHKHPEIIEAFYQGDMTYAIPGGESGEVFEDRVCRFLDRCFEEGKDLIIVSHGGVIRTALTYLLDADGSFPWHLNVNNGAVAEVVCHEGVCRLNTLINIA